MAKPVLLSVDDDVDVLRAIERDLRSKYGADYRVIGSDSPEGALTLLKQLKVRNDGVALLIADQRMPQMDGVAFLKEERRTAGRDSRGQDRLRNRHHEWTAGFRESSTPATRRSCRESRRYRGH